MWTVVFYVDGGVDKVLDRFKQKNEAEAYRAKFTKLVGEQFEIKVQYEEVEAAA